MDSKQLQANFPLNYSGISQVFFYKELSWQSRALFQIIYTLTKKHGYCFASDEYLSAIMETPIPTIQRWLSELKKESIIFHLLKKQRKKDGKWINQRWIFTRYCIPDDLDKKKRDTILESIRNSNLSKMMFSESELIKNDKLENFRLIKNDNSTSAVIKNENSITSKETKEERKKEQPGEKEKTAPPSVIFEEKYSVISDYYTFLEQSGIDIKTCRNHTDNRFTSHLLDIPVESVLESLKQAFFRLSHLHSVRAKLNKFELSRSGAGEPNYNIQVIWKNKDKIDEIWSGLSDELKPGFKIVSRVEEDKKRIDASANLEKYERPEDFLDSLEKLKAS